MTLSKKLSDSSLPWFGIGMTGIFLLSLALRFWGLGRFNALVFDEVYYAKFSNNYLTGTQFFNAHPPLSQYIIAIGIWIGSHLPFGQDTVNGLTGSLRSTWSYRWLNALTGSFIPLVVAALAYQLNQRRSYAFIAALFAAADGHFSGGISLRAKQRLFSHPWAAGTVVLSPSTQTSSRSGAGVGWLYRVFFLGHQPALSGMACGSYWEPT
jgi:hypothetical protein